MCDGSWKLDSALMQASRIDDVMHSSDQFDTLGFRLATTVVPPTCGDTIGPDTDQDCDADFVDFVVLQRCLSGPNVVYDPACVN